MHSSIKLGSNCSKPLSRDSADSRDAETSNKRSKVARTTDAHTTTVMAVETLLRAGEMLYIPAYWLAYDVSLGYSIACSSTDATLTHADENTADKKAMEKCLGMSVDALRYVCVSNSFIFY